VSEHTPTPWKAVPSVPSDGYECYWLVANFQGHNGEKEIGTLNGPHSGPHAANAAFIVKAVNNHDAFVKVLEKILRANADFVNAMPTGYEGDSLTDACDEAKALLADVGTKNTADK
jgi:hypothetical protein